MPNEVKTVRTSGFRLFNIGGRNKKKTIAVIIIAAVIAIAGTLFFVVGSHSIKAKTYEHLKGNGVEISEIKEPIVKYSFKQPFSNEWTVAVQYYDEPDVYYMYLHKDKILTYTGIAGMPEFKDESEYKHIENLKDIRNVK